MWILGLKGLKKEAEQGISSEERSRHSFFMENNLMHRISKLGYVSKSILSLMSFVHSIK